MSKSSCFVPVEFPPPPTQPRRGIPGKVYAFSIEVNFVSKLQGIFLCNDNLLQVTHKMKKIFTSCQSSVKAKLNRSSLHTKYTV